LDWEYPCKRQNLLFLGLNNIYSYFEIINIANRLGSRPSDRVQFTKLVAELKAAFRSENLLLTAAVAAGKTTIDSAYEVDKIAKY